MSEPISFHSTYLAPLARYKAAGRAGRILRRFGLLLLAAVLLGLLVFAVALRWLPRSGFGLLLYRLHDQVYLPLQGYTYTLFFPTSIVWWLIIALVALLCLMSLLLDRSFIRRPHTWLLRRSIHAAGSSVWLLKSANFLRWVGVQPDLLRSVVRHEWELALLAAAAKPAGQVGNHLCNQIRRWAVFAIRLQALPPAPPITERHLAAGVIWHASFLPLDLRRREDIRRLNMEEAGEQNAAAALAAQLPVLVGPPPYSPDDERICQENPFSPQRIILDVWRVALLAEPRLALAVPEAARPAPITQEGSTVRLALLLSCQDRVQALRGWARAMQQSSRSLLKGSAPAGRAAPELDMLDHASLSHLGHLALSLALHASWIGSAPDLALATLNAMEIVTLGTELQQGNAASPTPSTEAMRALLDGLPTPYAYSLTAQLVDLKTSERWRQWEPFAALPGSPIQGIDHQEALDHAGALFQAAGPGFWSSETQREGGA